MIRLVDPIHLKTNVIKPKIEKPVLNKITFTDKFSVKTVFTIFIIIFLLFYGYHFITTTEFCPDEEFLESLPPGIRNNEFFGKFRKKEDKKQDEESYRPATLGELSFAEF